tara:strand:- start:807 stop:1991 length:1185 start_codon:yes stop_codon:yes gene_type:complete
MLLEMKIPSPGESISEVEIAQWLVMEGDYVFQDQSIVEVDSDKATLEIPAEASGQIKILAQEGDIINVGETFCIIDTSIKPKSDEKVKKSSERIIKSEDELTKNLRVENATPLASSIIKREGVSSKDIKGTGNEGKITKSDVLDMIGYGKKHESRDHSRSKMSSLRRKISSRLVAVKNETAMLTTFNEVDMSEIINIRNNYKEEFKLKHNVGLGFMSFFTKSVTIALSEYKDVNAMIESDEIIHYNYSDIGIAVSAPKGLMVPIIRNAELLSFHEIEAEIKRLAIKARDGKITINEMMGGTFTITNGGVFGSMLSTPIINPPQSAILGMHNIVERAVVVNGKIEVRPIMYVALSYDHRIIDGRESVGFLCRVKECLEDPISKLMNNDIKNSLSL